MARLKRKTRRAVGLAAPAVASLPLLLPSPTTEPTVKIDPNADGTYIQGNEITSNQPLDDFALHHERGHALDDQRFTDEDRNRLRTVLRIKGNEPWVGVQGDLGPLAGTPSPAEIFADYYGALASGESPVRRKQGGITVADTMHSYTQIRNRRLKRVQQFLDQWARAQGQANVLR